MWLNKKALTAVQKKRRLFSKYKDNDHPVVKSQNKKAKELIRARKKIEKSLQRTLDLMQRAFVHMSEVCQYPSKHSDVAPTSSGRHVHRQRVVIQVLTSGRRPADVSD